MSKITMHRQLIYNPHPHFLHLKKQQKQNPLLHWIPRKDEKQTRVVLMFVKEFPIKRKIDVSRLEVSQSERCSILGRYSLISF